MTTRILSQIGKHYSYDGGCGDIDCELCKADARAANVRYALNQWAKISAALDKWNLEHGR